VIVEKEKIPEELVTLLSYGGRECDLCRRRLFGNGARGKVIRKFAHMHKEGIFSSSVVSRCAFEIVCCGCACFETADIWEG